MNNRLDFYNALGDHLETLGDDDTLLVISHNRKDYDLFYSFFGSWEDISLIFSNKYAVNHKGESKIQLEQIKEVILNTAYNICNEDEKVRDKLLKGLNALESINK